MDMSSISVNFTIKKNEFLVTVCRDLMVSLWTRMSTLFPAKLHVFSVSALNWLSAVETLILSKPVSWVSYQWVHKVRSPIHTACPYSYNWPWFSFHFSPFGNSCAYRSSYTSLLSPTGHIICCTSARVTFSKDVINPNQVTQSCETHFRSSVVWAVEEASTLLSIGLTLWGVSLELQQPQGKHEDVSMAIHGALLSRRRGRKERRVGGKERRRKGNSVGDLNRAQTFLVA